MGGLLHLVQRGGNGRAGASPRPLLAVPNATAHPLTASVPITVLQYNGQLLCGFNVGIKGSVTYRPKTISATTTSTTRKDHIGQKK